MLTTAAGDTWNESTVELDPWTRRPVRRVATRRNVNIIAAYHTNISFTDDGSELVFFTVAEGHQTVLCASTVDGTVRQLLDWLPATAGCGEHAVARHSRELVYRDGAAIRAVHLDSLARRTLVDDFYPGWNVGAPAITADGERVVLAIYKYIPGGRHYGTRIVSLAMRGGDEQRHYTEDGSFCGHIGACPTDPDRLLINRTYPPAADGKWRGSDGKTNRTWELRLSSGALTELPPQNEAKFQVHACWTWDGLRVIYHGGNGWDGGYIGMVNRDGTAYREYNYQHMPGYYGHVSAMAGRNAIILDGNVSDDLLVWLDGDDPDQPRIEVIARHGTEWGEHHQDQNAHPHPQSDPTGRYIAFNAIREGQSSVFVVEV